MNYLSRLLLLFITLSLTGNSVFAQYDARKKRKLSYEHKFSYIGIHAGVAIPTSDFGRSVETNDLVMGGDLGFQVSVDAAKYISKYIDLGIKGAYAMHTFDDIGMQTRFNDQNNELNVGNYSTIYGALGPIIKFPLGEGNYIDIKAYVGYMGFSYPSEESSTVPSNIANNFNREIDLGGSYNAAVLNPSISYRYYVSKKSCMAINFDYVRSGIDYNSQEYEIQWWTIGLGFLHRLGSSI
jgi:hypothetical protein